MLARLRRLLANATAPGAPFGRAADPSSIPTAVDYALQLATGYMEHFSRLGVEVARSAILELGPGADLGAQLILASHGARVTVADPFPVRWDPRFHPTYYATLRQRWTGRGAALDAVIAAQGYPSDVITCLARPAETLDGLADASFDLVVSNAVLEHVVDLPAACRALARVTRPGAVNSHQVDFRDHADFSRPLEFLTIGDRAITAEMARRRGNRLRASEVERLFRESGFAIESVEHTLAAEKSYLADLLPRLQRSASRYRDWPAAELGTLSARFVLRKHAA